MIYLVTAHLKPERADEYLTKLSEGTIKSKRPVGGEIVDAMNRVVGTVTVGDWYTQTTCGGWVSFGRRSTVN